VLGASVKPTPLTNPSAIVPAVQAPLHSHCNSALPTPTCAQETNSPLRVLAAQQVHQVLRVVGEARIHVHVGQLVAPGERVAVPVDA